MPSDSTVILTLPAQPARVAARRNAGLDLARTLAILAVYVAHLGGEFVAGAAQTALVFLGAMGVELFFALSGFLIGRILIGLAEAGATPGRVGRFWVRRWLRTLPLYYIVWLAMSWRLDLWNWRDLLFLQNFYPDQSQALVVSWSLVMEEFFYLLFPIFLFAAGLLARLGPRGGRRIGARAVLGIAVLEIVGCNALRFLALGGWFGAIRDGSFHTAPLMRLDCAAYGVAAAALVAVVRPSPTARSAWPLAITAAGVGLFVALCTLLFVRIFDPHFQAASGFVYWARYYFTLQYSVMDASFAVLVVALWRGLKRLPSWIGPPVAFVSQISYSLYLDHAPLLAFFLRPAVARFGQAGGVCVLTAAVIALSWLTWRAIERPFLALRDRYVPS